MKGETEDASQIAFGILKFFSLSAARHQQNSSKRGSVFGQVAADVQLTYSTRFYTTPRKLPSASRQAPLRRAHGAAFGQDLRDRGGQGELPFLPQDGRVPSWRSLQSYPQQTHPESDRIVAEHGMQPALHGVGTHRRCVLHFHTPSVTYALSLVVPYPHISCLFGAVSAAASTVRPEWHADPTRRGRAAGSLRRVL